MLSPLSDGAASKALETLTTLRLYYTDRQHKLSTLALPLQYLWSGQPSASQCLETLFTQAPSRNEAIPPLFFLQVSSPLPEAGRLE